MPAPDSKTVAPSVPTLNHKLYAVLTKVTARPSEAQAHKPEHIQYINGLVTKGKVLASGPFAVTDNGSDMGLILLRASSFEEAEVLMKAEPMTARGLSTYELNEWHVVMGQVPLTLNFSTGTFNI